MLLIDEEEAIVVRRIYDWYLEGYSIGGIIDKLEEREIKASKGKERWSKRAIESTLTREKYTGDVAIVNSGESEDRYFNKNHREWIISKEQFEVAQLEMKLRSNVEIGQDGKIRRKSRKYSSKKVNRCKKSYKKGESKCN